MTGSYIRDFKHNYLVIRDDRVIGQDYEIKMITKNRIDGLISCEDRMVNGEGFLYYDVTSKHVLKSVMSEELIDFETVRTLFLSIISVCSRMEKYLMYDDGLIFDPEYIFYDIETKDYSFIYYKDEDSGNPEKLFEFLIEHLDNDDFQAVEAVYQMSDMSKRSFYAFDEVLTWFREQYEDNKADHPDNGDIENIVHDAEYPVSPEVPVSVPEKDRYDEWEKEYEEKTKKKRERKSFFELLRGFFFKSEKEKDEDELFEEYYEETYEETKADDTGDNATVFIPWVENSEHKLYGTGRGNKTHIDLSSVPVTIGKMRGAADIILNDESISRLHAKLLRNGSRFFLLDLNSTNGSYKNGVRLSPNEQVVIEPGDEIGFGKLKFIYR
ncbi:MAG: FHA domain-containing protein [Lachnospiraceae bacterium]|nr:FHA domain-containing protein [Lachnospiraceae bacterium]